MATTIKRPFRTFNGTDWDKHYFETSEDMLVNIAQSLSGTGYRKLPGGLILQWGTYITPTNGTNGVDSGVYYKVISRLALPIALPNKICSIQVTPSSARCWGFGDSKALDEINIGCANIINADKNDGITLNWVVTGY